MILSASMGVELLYSGYYRDPEIYISTFTFLRLYPAVWWLFSQEMFEDLPPFLVKAATEGSAVVCTISH